MLHPVGFYHSSGGSDTVTVTGTTISDSEKAPDDANAMLKIDNDGNTYYYSGPNGGAPTWTQHASTTDWVRPTTSSPGLYEVRFTSFTGDALWSSTAAVDVWHSLSGGDFILHQLAAGASALSASTFTIQIRYNGGSVLASGIFTLDCDTFTK